MATEDAAAIWQDVAGRVLVGFDAWIEAIVAEARAGKHLAPPDDVRPAGAPGARWITRGRPVMTASEDPDPWQERLRFAQLFLRYLDTLGRPFLPAGQPPITAEDYLEMLALGEMLGETDRGCVADPDYYRDAAYLHGALTAGATWAQLAEATGDDEATARRRYRTWAEDQHRLWGRKRYEGPERT
jgi:hypothetical protein